MEKKKWEVNMTGKELFDISQAEIQRFVKVRQHKSKKVIARYSNAFASNYPRWLKDGLKGCATETALNLLKGTMEGLRMTEEKDYTGSVMSFAKSCNVVYEIVDAVAVQGEVVAVMQPYARYPNWGLLSLIVGGVIETSAPLIMNDLLEKARQLGSTNYTYPTMHLEVSKRLGPLYAKAYDVECAAHKEISGRVHLKVREAIVDLINVIYS
jgi:hypothetical protein